MARSLIIETTFLIDLERERHRDSPGPATRFLEQNPRDELVITETVAGEMACGVPPSGIARLEKLLAPFGVLAMTRAVALQYGRIYRYLSDQGLLIGSNDLWIAAAALTYVVPVVTADADHYRRVPDLEVLSYR